MLKVISKIEALRRCDRGATAIEYGLIAAGIAVGIAVVVFTFGDNLKGLFDGMNTQLTSRS